MTTISKIKIAIALELDDYLEDTNKNKIADLASGFKNIMNSPKNLAFIAAILDINEYSDKNGFDPKEFSEKIARFLNKKTKYRLQKDTRSKTLSKLKRLGILERTEYKQYLKKEFPELYSRGRGKSQRKPGFPVRYKLTDSVSDYTRLLNDPKVLEAINQALLTFDNLLVKFYQSALKDIFYIVVEHGDPTIYEFFSITKTPLNLDIDTSNSDWEKYRIELSKLSEDEHKRHIDEMTNTLLQNPMALLFFLLCLTRKDYDQK